MTGIKLPRTIQTLKHTKLVAEVFSEMNFSSLTAYVTTVASLIISISNGQDSQERIAGIKYGKC